MRTCLVITTKSSGLLDKSERREGEREKKIKTCIPRSTSSSSQKKRKKRKKKNQPCEQEVTCSILQISVMCARRTTSTTTNREANSFSVLRRDATEFSALRDRVSVLQFVFFFYSFNFLFFSLPFSSRSLCALVVNGNCSGLPLARSSLREWTCCMSSLDPVSRDSTKIIQTAIGAVALTAPFTWPRLVPLALPILRGNVLAYSYIQGNIFIFRHSKIDIIECDR